MKHKPFFRHELFTEKVELRCDFTNEPRHEKPCFSHIRTTKVEISLRIRAI